MEVDNYLNILKDLFFDHFKEDAVSFYIGGSYSQNDFGRESDLDVYAFIQKNQDINSIKVFENSISQTNLPCPAKGLEFHLIEWPFELIREPNFIFVLSDGETWELETEYNYSVGENLIALKNIKDCGILLQGEEIKTSIPDIPDDWLKEEVLKVVEWHKDQIHDSFHDPYGYQAVLNSCRALCFLKTKKLVSKSFGGEWFLNEFSEFSALVKKALVSRSNTLEKLPHSEVLEFLGFVQMTFRKG